MHFVDLAAAVRGKIYQLVSALLRGGHHCFASTCNCFRKTSDSS